MQRGTLIAGSIAGLGLALLAGWWLAAPSAPDSRGEQLAVAQRNVPVEADTQVTLPAATASAAQLLTETVADDDAPAEAAALAAAPVDARVAGLHGEDCRLSGRVVDAAGLPLAGALVTHVPSQSARGALGIHLNDFAPDLPRERLVAERTGNDGRFALATRDLLPAEVPSAQGASIWGPDGSLPVLLVEHAGHESVAHHCRGFEGGSHDVGDIALQAGGALAGRVVDEDGRAIADALVHPARSRTHGRALGEVERITTYATHALTGANGRFLLDGLPAAELELVISAAGFLGWTGTQTVPLGAPRELGDIVLERGGRLAGRVLGPDHRPVPDASVVMRSAMALKIFTGEDSDAAALHSRMRINNVDDVRTTTDAHGRFEVWALDLPDYVVYAGAPGLDATRGGPYPVGTTEIELRLGPEASILLRVQDSDSGEAVEAELVSTRRLAGLDPRAAGHFAPLTVLSGAEAATAAGLPAPEPGLFLLGNAGHVGNHVIVTAPGYAKQGFALPGVQPSERIEFTVELQPQSILAGRVVDDQGRPLPRALVLATPPTTLPVRLEELRTTADATGAFRFEGLVPAEWIVRAEAAGHVPGDWIALAVERGAAREDLELVLETGAVITGLVVNVAGVPQAGRSAQARWDRQSGRDPRAAVSATAAGSATATPLEPPATQVRRTAMTDAEGRFRIDGLLPGEWIVAAHRSPDQHVTLAARGEVELVFVVRELPVLRGRVTRAGRPVEGAIVRAREQIGETAWWAEDKEATTSVLGDYELVLAGPGRFGLQARHGDTHSTWSVVELDWDRDALVDFELGSGRLAGEVRAAQGNAPVAGLRVTARNRTVMAQAAAKKMQFVRADARATTDAQGRFVIEGLLPGDYEITSGAQDGWAAASTEAQLPPGGSVDELSLLVFPEGP